MAFPIWHALAAIAEIVPGAPLSRSQVELMQTDTVVATGMLDLDALGISPKPLEPVLEEIIGRG
jgi:NADH dehydrogenase